MSAHEEDITTDNEDTAVELVVSLGVVNALTRKLLKHSIAMPLGCHEELKFISEQLNAAEARAWVVQQRVSYQVTRELAESVPLRPAPQCPSGKVCHTLRTANESAARVKKRGRGEMRIYACPECGHHHLTHKH